jgi:hypothetical protein
MLETEKKEKAHIIFFLLLQLHPVVWLSASFFADVMMLLLPKNFSTLSAMSCEQDKKICLVDILHKYIPV